LGRIFGNKHQCGNPQNPQKTEKLKKPSRCPRSFERPLTVMFFTQPSSGSLATPSPALGGLQIPSGLVVQSCTSHPEEEELFIGTQFSHLSTAVDTSAAAACNAWCVRVCVFFSSFFFEALHPADVSAPVFSGTSAFSLRLTPSRLTPGATSALQSPPRFHLCPSLPFWHVRFTSPLHPGFYYTER
jgi:hypothetical protein